jgi:hypothetical protein
MMGLCHIVGEIKNIASIGRQKMHSMEFCIGVYVAGFFAGMIVTYMILRTKGKEPNEN